MKITSFKAENVFSFDHKGIKFTRIPKFMQLVGPNDSGKTNFFRTLLLTSKLLDPRSNENIITHEYRGERNALEVPQIELKLKLSNSEAYVFGAYLVFSTMDTEYTPVPPNEKQETISDSVAIVANSCKAFEEMWRGDIAISIKSSGLESYNKPSINIYFQSGIIFSEDTGTFTNTPVLFGRSLRNNVPFIKIIADTIRKKYPRMFLKESLTENDKKLLTILGHSLNSEWLRREIARTDIHIQSFHFNGLVNKLYNRKKEYGMVVERLAQVLGMSPSSSYGINIKLLFSILFNNSLVMLSDARSTPYVENAFISSLEQSPEITGQKLANDLMLLKQNADLQQRSRYEEIKKNFENYFKGKSFDVVEVEQTNMSVDKEASLHELDKIRINNLRLSHYVEENFLSNSESRIYYKAKEPKIYVVDIAGNYQVPLEESAAGIFETLLILYSTIGMKDAVLLLDEPAQNLHPNRQLEILKFIKESQNQVIMATHSPYMIDYKSPNNIYRLEKSLTSTKLNNLIIKKKSKIETIIKEFGRNNKLASILFAKKVIFFEGDNTEEVATRIWYDKKYGDDMHYNNVLWVSGGPKSHLHVCISLAMDWGIDWTIVCDNNTFTHPENRTLDKLIQKYQNKFLCHSKNDFTDYYKEPKFKSKLPKIQRKYGPFPIKDPRLAKLMAEAVTAPSDFNTYILPALHQFINF